ncbi:hypothetical protein PRIPAC_96940 [Pristionchus pacificus]|uniref:Uncharacterized protein n=1 Tax=Pristionchus pacificus TaxID=54126 RepID=A0A2A6B331_PRIPA|nr:hypothetical protein PRIPAC_96940 [Pristionchus pacificus]|eukprot:PDM60271.1 hypothetical protein PRIPAC_54096 [Pristionchus pacificus]
MAFLLKQTPPKQGIIRNYLLVIQMDNKDDKSSNRGSGFTSMLHKGKIPTKYSEFMSVMSKELRLLHTPVEQSEG